jgi:hypothetical protein
MNCKKKRSNSERGRTSPASLFFVQESVKKRALIFTIVTEVATTQQAKKNTNKSRGNSAFEGTAPYPLFGAENLVAMV